MKKVALTTFGCRANQYDTAALEQALGQSFKVVDFDEKADYYIINSCAITNQAEIDALHLIRKKSKENPASQIVVTGCAAQVSSEKFQDSPGVSLVVGNDSKDQVLSFLSEKSEAPLKPKPLGRSKTERLKLFYGGGVELAKHSRAFLKIQDGCSQFCSFCIVPYARGLNRSVDPNQIIDSLFELGEKGVQEVVLTGIHLGTYGHDFNPRTSLLDLLRRIDERKPVPRIRLSSIDPEEVSLEMVSFLKSSPLFCEHLHLPLQSGDDGVLKRMRRRYQAKDFIRLCENIVDQIPDICIGTDVIVGFPGEGELEFNHTLEVLSSSPLHYAHVFPYSQKEGTKAMEFDDPVSAAVKKNRVKIARTLMSEKRAQFYGRFEGRKMEVVWENRNRGLTGLSRNYIPIEVEKGREVPGHMGYAHIERVEREKVIGFSVNGSFMV